MDSRGISRVWGRIKESNLKKGWNAAEPHIQLKPGAPSLPVSASPYGRSRPYSSLKSWFLLVVENPATSSSWLFYLAALSTGKRTSTPLPFNLPCLNLQKEPIGPLCNTAVSTAAPCWGVGHGGNTTWYGQPPRREFPQLIRISVGYHFILFLSSFQSQPHLVKQEFPSYVLRWKTSIPAMSKGRGCSLF